MKSNLSKKKVVVGISGGVDSAMCLDAFCAQGFDVTAIYIKMCRYAGDLKSDIESARSVAKTLGVKLQIIDAKELFCKKVVSYYDNQIKTGNTPSPCVFCNPEVKFATLLDYANKVGAYYVATGHYAQVIEKGGLFFLKQAVDKSKDQTYSLSFLDQGYLSRMILPLGTLKKSEVLQMPKKISGLEYLSGRKQSQDFCYLGQTPQEQYCLKAFPATKGEIVDRSGKILGYHNGIYKYTIGQRKGIRLPGGPYFVVEKDTKGNKIVVSKDERDLYKSEVILKPYNLVRGRVGGVVDVLAKIRSTQELAPARLSQDGSALVLRFDKSQRAITPGQVAVFYEGDICVGAGVISSARP